MSENQNFGFGKFVPGFDFLQNLTQGASSIGQLPSLSNWVAPTLNVDELKKRIDELKTVHFWLEQNGKALAATIQALEVQKMTLATLQGMNFNMGDVAQALKLNPAGKRVGAAQGMGQQTASTARPVPVRASATAAQTGAAPLSQAPDDSAAAGVADPLQWWGALTQQFQQIAAGALHDATSQITAGQTPPGPAKKRSRPATGGSKTAHGSTPAVRKQTATRAGTPSRNSASRRRGS